MEPDDTLASCRSCGRPTRITETRPRARDYDYDAAQGAVYRAVIRARCCISGNMSHDRVEVSRERVRAGSIAVPATHTDLARRQIADAMTRYGVVCGDCGTIAEVSKTTSDPDSALAAYNRDFNPVQRVVLLPFVAIMTAFYAVTEPRAIRDRVGEAIQGRADRKANPRVYYLVRCPKCKTPISSGGPAAQFWGSLVVEDAPKP